MPRVAKKYAAKGKVWLWPGEQGAWHFMYVDKKISEDIKARQKGKMRRGFGGVRVEVKTGKTVWETSIFPDSRSGTYLLPLKASVRRAESLFESDPISFTLKLL